MNKTLKMLALVLPLAVAGGVWAFRSEPDRQGPWADLAARCATFDGARIAFSFDDDTLGETRAFYLHASGHGAIGIDEFNGYNTRYAWSKGEPFTKHWRNQPSPRVVADAAAHIEDLWEECRAGFTSSVWHHDPAPTAMSGHSTLWSWARLELPFAWAEGVSVWVAAEADTGRIARIVADRPGESLVVTVAEVDWAAEVDPAQLSATSPAVGPTRPPYFRTGLSPEDIPGDSPPLTDVSPPAWAPTVVTPNCISQPDGGLVKPSSDPPLRPARRGPPGG